MKKILLILSLALMCSFNANAQQSENEKSSEPCVVYTAQQALDVTKNDNKNAFAAIYSTNTARDCNWNGPQNGNSQDSGGAREDRCRGCNATCSTDCAR